MRGERFIMLTNARGAGTDGILWLGAFQRSSNPSRRAQHWVLPQRRILPILPVRSNPMRRCISRAAETWVVISPLAGNAAPVSVAIGAMGWMCPLAEESERYELEILQGTTRIRTITGLHITHHTFTPPRSKSTDFGSVQRSV